VRSIHKFVCVTLFRALPFWPRLHATREKSAKILFRSLSKKRQM